MTSLEARTLTIARRGESWIAYVLRTEVWPTIEQAAGACQYNALFVLSNEMGPRWVTHSGDSLAKDVIKVLESNGFTVQHVGAGAHGPEEVRVSW